MGFFDKFKKQPVAAEGGVPKAVRVSDFLNDKTIAFFPAGPSKRQVFGNLIGTLGLSDPGEALKAILAREEAGSTVISPDMALPHARIAGLNTIKASLGICPGGIEYTRIGGDKVRLVVLFFGPAENMRLHLAFLAQVSALFQNQAVCEALIKVDSPGAALKVIRDAEQKLSQ
jgi:mannitol/fructose-specific phosphotransferase system IIA component (Ntr-type)